MGTGLFSRQRQSTIIQGDKAVSRRQKAEGGEQMLFILASDF
jgi:hypothetical protein